MASTAELLRDKLGIESPFSDESKEEPIEEETSESISEEPQEEDSEEDSEEISEEEESEDESEEEPEKDSEIDSEKVTKENSNLKMALKEERGLRQTAQTEIESLTNNANESNNLSQLLQEEIDSIKQQAKEQDIEDLFDFKSKIDPEVLQLRAEKAQIEAQKQADHARSDFDTGMVSEAKSTISNFNNIDLTNNEHGLALQSMVYSNHLVLGMELKDAVKSAMGTLDTMLTTNLKKRTPPVKPKRKLKAVSKTASSAKKDLSPIERIRIAREAAEK